MAVNETIELRNQAAATLWTTVGQLNRLQSSLVAAQSELMNLALLDLDPPENLAAASELKKNVDIKIQEERGTKKLGQTPLFSDSRTATAVLVSQGKRKPSPGTNSASPSKGESQEASNKPLGNKTRRAKKAHLGV